MVVSTATAAQVTSTIKTKRSKLLRERKSAVMRLMVRARPSNPSAVPAANTSQCPTESVLV